MEIHHNSPYKKLASTPLALDTKICELNPVLVAYILGIISILTGPLPCSVVSFWIIQGDYDRSQALLHMGPPKDFDSHFKDFKNSMEKDKHSRDILLQKISGGLAIIFSVIHLIGIIIMFYGASKKMPQYYYYFFVTCICNILFSKFMFSVLLIPLEAPYYQYIILLIVPDIILIIFMMITFGQIAALARNKRYMTESSGIKYNPAPGDPHAVEAGRTLLPPGSYPQQIPSGTYS